MTEWVASKNMGRLPHGTKSLVPLVQRDGMSRIKLAVEILRTTLSLAEDCVAGNGLIGKGFGRRAIALCSDRQPPPTTGITMR